MIFYPNSLNVHICASQRYRESVDIRLRVPWLHGLFLTTTGGVAHDAILNQILGSDVILNIRILICFALDR